MIARLKQMVLNLVENVKVFLGLKQPKEVSLFEEYKYDLQETLKACNAAEGNCQNANKEGDCGGCCGDCHDLDIIEVPLNFEKPKKPKKKSNKKKSKKTKKSQKK